MAVGTAFYGGTNPFALGMKTTAMHLEARLEPIKALYLRRTSEVHELARSQLNDFVGKAASNSKGSL